MFNSAEPALAIWVLSASPLFACRRQLAGVLKRCGRASSISTIWQRQQWRVSATTGCMCGMVLWLARCSEAHVTLPYSHVSMLQMVASARGIRRAGVAACVGLLQAGLVEPAETHTLARDSTAKKGEKRVTRLQTGTCDLERENGRTLYMKPFHCKRKSPSPRKVRMHAAMRCVHAHSTCSPLNTQPRLPACGGKAPHRPQARR